MFISRYVEEDLPDNFDEIDPISENIVFTAQVGIISLYNLHDLIYFD